MLFQDGVEHELCSLARRAQGDIQQPCDSPHHRESLAGTRAREYVKDARRIDGDVAMRSCDAVVPSHHSDAV
jgi:hypothetical protein